MTAGGIAGTGPLAGFTIAVTADRQHNGLATLLKAQGARIVVAPAMRSVSGEDDPPLRRLVDLIGSRLVDAVTFTSATAGRSVLHAGGPLVLDRLRTDVLAACLGPVAARPLVSREVPVLAPDRPRLGALVDLLVGELPKRAPTLKVAGALVTLRGHAAMVNETLKPLAPGPMAVLRALAEADGEVQSRTVLQRALPHGASAHAVDMAVLRLRIALGGTAFVEAVVRRGYRLAVD
jgi:uroporphyrinogen-III synthase